MKKNLKKIEKLRRKNKIKKMGKLPFLPAGREIFYVDEKNKFLCAAKNFATKNSLDRAHPTGAVVVKNGEILGAGANGSDFHEKFGCERKKLGIATGEKYELCAGCSPKNHAEQRAIAAAQKNFPEKVAGADLFLWGHFWCCESCWQKIIDAKIKNVFLQKNAEKFLKKNKIRKKIK